MYLPNTAQTKPKPCESKPPLWKRAGWLVADMIAAVLLGVVVGWLLWLWNPLGGDDDV